MQPYILYLTTFMFMPFILTLKTKGLCVQNFITIWVTMIYVSANIFQAHEPKTLGFRSPFPL